MFDAVRKLARGRRCSRAQTHPPAAEAATAATTTSGTQKKALLLT